MKKTIFTLGMIMLWGHVSLFAGWVITEETSHPMSDALVVSETILIQDQKMKTASSDGTFIFNLKTDEIILINDKDKIYWSGNIESFREEASETMKMIVDELLEQFPEQQREMFKSMFDGMAEMYDEPNPEIMDALSVSVEKTGESETIAGYESRKYTVTANGKQVEEVWISSRPNISGEFDMKELHEVLNQISPVASPEDYYGFSDKYLDLLSSGFVMRTVDADGMRTEVTNIEEKQIDDSEFLPGPGYKKMDLTELFKMMMKDNDSDNPGH